MSRARGQAKAPTVAAAMEPARAASPAAGGDPPPASPRAAAGPGGVGGRGGLLGWLRRRGLGRGPFVDPARDNYRALTGLYSAIQPADSVSLSTRTHGAVFNLEYSPDG